MAGGQHHHRSTLKQKNKSFKSRHATKSSIKKIAKGRPAGKQSQGGATTEDQVGAAARRNYAKQLQLRKREEIKAVEEMFTKRGVPKLVSVLELTPDANAWNICQMLQQHRSVQSVEGHSVEETIQSGDAACRIRIPKLSTTLQFMPLPYGALYPALSAVASSDFVIFVLSPSQSIESGSWGELVLRILHAQGMPEVLAVVPTLQTEDVGSSSSAAANGVRKSLTSFVKYFAPSTERIYSVDVEAERDGLLRTLASSVPRFPSWREARPYLVAEEAAFVADPSSSSGNGTLRVAGWARGNANFSAQRLVHVRDFGDIRVKRILDGSIGGKRKHKPKGDVDMADSSAIRLSEDGLTILDERDEEEADDLQSENAVSDEEFGQEEQTWPTEEEVAAGEKRQRKLEREEGKEDKYKTRWLIDESDGEEDGNEDEEEEEDEDEDEDEDEVLLDGTNGTGQAMDADSKVNGNGMVAETDDGDFDDPEEDFDDGAESDDDAALYERNRERSDRAADDLEFPDEVDTPLHIPAKQRFARYRGLASLRSSTWDAYEELPAEYSKIFQFDDWERVKRAVEGKARIDGVSPGTRIILELEDVSVEMARRFGAVGVEGAAETRRLPMTVWGLLRHEHKKTVMNLTVLRNTEFTETIKSKDPVLLLLGPRLLCVNPIYSEHSLASSTSKPIPSAVDGSVQVHPHKFARFLPPPSPTPSVATIYAPITFGSPSITLLRPRAWSGEAGYDERGVGANQYPDLVGSGSLLKRNGNGPLRVNVKRVILTGEPFKIHKKTATIRWMFFNPDDVRYFSPIPLRTKYGRTGHISEPLGTHGRYKAHFDGPIGQMDTIMMSLYKRVYPRYTTVEYRQGNDELPLKYLEAKEGVGATGSAEAIKEMEM